VLALIQALAVNTGGLELVHSIGSEKGILNPLQYFLGLELMVGQTVGEADRGRSFVRL